MIEPREEWQLPTRRLGRRVLVFDRLESTNTYVASLAHDSANDGVVILADEQRAGRGQHGRTWTCPPGAGILLSVLMFPPPPLRRPVLLAAWAAVAVCETIRLTTGQQAKIKWPNDVLVRGRKVCGILIEQSRGTVAGVGLNVNQSAESFAAAKLPDAGSLALFTTTPLVTHDVARILITQFDEEYDRLCSGDLGTLEARWKMHSGLLGQTVAVECHDTEHVGRLVDMTWDAVILQGEGESRSLRPETVRHIREQTG
jgi:BirA family transcriptional regulator, biotin operon repressor / biotin---[acetyl-CoA-carboxylase] ligase